MAWIDACSHAVLSARTLINMHKMILESGESGDEWKVDISDLEEEIDHLTKFINEAMWDEEAGFYHDRKYGLHPAVSLNESVPSTQAPLICRLSALTGRNKDSRAGLSTEVKTIGAYWTLLAGVVPQERLERFVAHLDKPSEFKTTHRIPALRYFT